MLTFLIILSTTFNWKVCSKLQADLNSVEQQQCQWGECGSLKISVCVCCFLLLARHWGSCRYWFDWLMVGGGGGMVEGDVACFKKYGDGHVHAVTKIESYMCQVAIKMELSRFTNSCLTFSQNHLSM